MPLYLDGKADVIFAAKGGQKRYSLDANCAYFFGRNADGQVDLQKIGLGEDGTAADGRKLPDKASRAPTVTIPVKILVDEEEPGRPGIWEQRLKRRVESASAVFEKNYHVAFRVAAIGTWKSDNATTDFFDSLAEFEQKVDPAPAKLAIGFTSQWPMARGRIHMAGTRGPLHAHILVREGSPEINEPERLEFLVHELGHYLGAAHSPEWQSVMRPVLGDKRAGRSDFRIQFDPVNALTVAMISEEIRRSNISHISQLQYTTRRRLEQIYLQLARTMPEDPAGFQYAGLMRTNESPLAMSTRLVLQQIVRAAVENHALPVTAVEGSKQPTRREGDALTAYYVREAARAASALPADVAAQSFLLAVAVGLDSSATPANLSGVAGLLRTVESPQRAPNSAHGTWQTHDAWATRPRAAFFLIRLLNRHQWRGSRRKQPCLMQSLGKHSGRAASVSRWSPPAAPGAASVGASSISGSHSGCWLCRSMWRRTCRRLIRCRMGFRRKT